MEKLNWKDCMKLAAIGPHLKGGFASQISMSGPYNPPPVTTKELIAAMEELANWNYNKKKK